MLIFWKHSSYLPLFLLHALPSQSSRFNHPDYGRYTVLSYQISHCGAFSTSHSHPCWAQIFASGPCFVMPLELFYINIIYCKRSFHQWTHTTPCNFLSFPILPWSSLPLKWNPSIFLFMQWNAQNFPKFNSGFRNKKNVSKRIYFPLQRK